MNDLADEIRISNPKLLVKLREAVPKDTWMLHLDDQQLITIYLKLQKGFTNSEVAAFCEEEFGVKGDFMLIMTTIVKFRTKVFDDTALIRAEAALDNPEAKKLECKLNELSSDLDAMGRLGWLINMQTDRVLALKAREDQAKIPLEATTNNIKVLQGLLDSYITKQMDLGILNSAVPRVKLDIDHKFKAILGGLEDSGERMIDITHQFIESAQDKILTLRVNDDGSYELNDSREKVNTTR